MSASPNSKTTSRWPPCGNEARKTTTKRRLPCNRHCVVAAGCFHALLFLALSESPRRRQESQKVSKKACRWSVICRKALRTSLTRSSTEGSSSYLFGLHGKSTLCWQGHYAKRRGHNKPTEPEGVKGMRAQRLAELPHHCKLHSRGRRT